MKAPPAENSAPSAALRSPIADAKCGAEKRPKGEVLRGPAAPRWQLSAAATSPKKSNDSPIRVADSPATENLEGERKTVTALFADIKGSTELKQDLDPEEARAIVDPALRLMIDAVRRYDGYVVQSTGDGIFALFGAPVARALHDVAVVAADRVDRSAQCRMNRARFFGVESCSSSVRYRQTAP